MRWIAILFLVMGQALPYGAFAADSKGDPIRIQVPVIPGISKYLDLLPYPAYLALALENNGIGPSLSSRLVLESATQFKVRNATVRYVGRKNLEFSYEAAVSVDFGIGETGLKIPFTVDASNAAKGEIMVLAYPPLARMVPEALIERARFKAKVVADAASQRMVLEYLDKLAVRAPAPPSASGVTALFEPILFDAYNRSGGAAKPNAREPGDAEPISDQALLFASLLIWLVGVPIFLLRKRLRFRRTPASGS